MTLKTKLISSYLEWLKTEITLNDLDNGAIEITTPLMDRYNDYLQIYVVPTSNDTIKLSDDGYILSDLYMSGVNIVNSDNRKIIFNNILNGFGVNYSAKTEELFIQTTVEDFPQKKHMLLQAMLSINDMFMISRSNVQSIFLEDVENFLIINEIRYTENVPFIGISGYSHKFNFVIPRSKNAPERLICALNNPTREKTKNILFSWNDIKSTRKEGSMLYTFLNDAEKKYDPEIINAFKNYNVIPIPWSEKEQFKEELIA